MYVYIHINVQFTPLLFYKYNKPLHQNYKLSSYYNSLESMQIHNDN